MKLKKKEKFQYTVEKKLQNIKRRLKFRSIEIFLTHHNVVALHLGLLLGEFLQLQFNTGQNKQENAHVSKTLVNAGLHTKASGQVLK